jgi:hypothetical protein
MPIKIGTADYKSPLSKIYQGTTLVYQALKNKVLSYVGTVAIATPRQDSTMGTIGNYACIIGGRTPNGWNGRYATIDAINENLTVTNASLVTAGRGCGIANFNNKLFVLGGDGTTKLNRVETIDENLTIGSSTNLGAKRMPAGSTNRSLMFAIGGEGSSKYVDIFDSNLTRTTGTSLTNYSYRAENQCSNFGTNNEYVVHGNGYDSLGDAYAYDTNGTRTSLSSLTYASTSMGTTFAGKAVFACGSAGTGNTANKTVQYYDDNFTLHSGASSTYNHRWAMRCNIDDELLVVTGDVESNVTTGTNVDVWDKDLTNVTSTYNVSTNKAHAGWDGVGATKLGKYVFIYGGSSNDQCGVAEVLKYE